MRLNFPQEGTPFENDPSGEKNKRPTETARRVEKNFFHLFGILLVLVICYLPLLSAFAMSAQLENTAPPYLI